MPWKLKRIKANSLPYKNEVNDYLTFKEISDYPSSKTFRS